MDLVRAGADRDDPAFIHAFAAAKAARRDRSGQVQALARVEAARQHARDIETRVAAQAAVAAVLAENRRFVHSDFLRAFDAAEDALLDQEEQLRDAAADCGGGGAAALAADGAWLDEEDETLLAQWLLQSAPRVELAAARDWPGEAAGCPAGSSIAAHPARCGHEDRADAATGRGEDGPRASRQSPLAGPP